MTQSGCSWLGDFTPYGGMDMANFALARHLARVEQTHLVAHHVSPELTALANVHVHAVPRPFGVHRFGEPILRVDGGPRATQPGGG